MQKALPTFFLFLYLFSALLPGRVVEELGKLPQLVAHFEQHKKDNPSISLGSFLAQHYGAGFAQHQSEHNHSNLPGKDHNTHFTCCGQQMPAISERFVPFYLKVLLPEHIESGLFSTSQLPSSQYLSGIWQPPKAV